MLGGTYGRRVVVLAGKGNNGNDGRDAARRLRRRGVRVVEVDAHGAPAVLPSADLVIDAAFGTGFRGDWSAPETSAPVLAVDIPSGVDGLTGSESERVLRAERTVTFAALKPGLLLPPGSELTGEIEVADIGLDTSTATASLLTDDDVAAIVPERLAQAHKWKAAVWVAAGSPGMTGAAHLAARGAQRAGAGYVRLGTPGVDHDAHAPTEVVGHALPPRGMGPRRARRSGPVPLPRRRPRLGTGSGHSLRGRGCDRVRADPARDRWRRAARGRAERAGGSRPPVAPRAHPPRRGVRGHHGSRARGRSLRGGAHLGARPAAVSCCSRDRRRSSPTRPAVCSSRTRAARAWRPQERAMCSPGSSVRSWPGASLRSRPRLREPSCTDARAT